MSRRNLLTDGAISGLGLTLADFFQARQAQAEIKKYDFLPAKAQSVIHIYLPGGWRIKNRLIPSNFRRLSIVAKWAW